MKCKYGSSLRLAMALSLLAVLAVGCGFRLTLPDEFKERKQAEDATPGSPAAPAAPAAPTPANN
jgi:hypothetical protein